MPHLKDKILLNRIKHDDHDAFGKAYDEYIDQIYRFIYFKIGSKESAEDLTSSVFLKTWNYIQEKGTGNHKSIKPLLYRVARTTVIDHYRKNQDDQISIDDLDTHASDIKDNSQDVHKQAEINSDMKVVRAKMRELKDEYREVVVMRFIDELSISEIAEILEKNKGNVRVLVYRALKALREIINNQES